MYFKFVGFWPVTGPKLGGEPLASLQAHTHPFTPSWWPRYFSDKAKAPRWVWAPNPQWSPRKRERLPADKDWDASI